MSRITIRTAAGIFISAVMLLPVAGPASAESSSDDEKAFYYLGTMLSQNLLNLDLSGKEIDALVAGLKASLKGEAESLDDAVYGPKLNQIAQERIAAAALVEEAAAQAYVDKMAAEKGAVETASGLVYLDLQTGDGEQPTAASTVKAHYTGTLRDGTVFDSSVDRGEPLVIPLGNVIPCWTEAIAMMREGGKSKITCPANIAYGPSGSGPIPPNAALTFEVELIEVVE
jgi:FKBP-type peptidyl-prolyl cis-trans isomerase FkpA/FKBP-type peptidyl-prolyl cis-trans isomerase FklB